MAALVLDGRRRRDEILADLASELEAAGRPPVTFATVLVGDDEASLRYVGLKHKAAEQIGLRVWGLRLPASVDQLTLESALLDLSEDPSVHGILLQLPLPAGSELDELAASSMIDPGKDVDGMTATSLGRLVLGRPGHVSCTAAGILDLLDRYGIPTAGQRAVIVGRGPLVALPLGLLLAGSAAAVCVVDPDGDSLPELCRAADLVVADASRPHLIRADWIKPGATVIDVGVSWVDGQLVGDVDPGVAAVAGAVAPNPGGAGPMTVAMLLRNTVRAAGMGG